MEVKTTVECNKDVAVLPNVSVTTTVSKGVGDNVVAFTAVLDGSLHNVSKGTVVVYDRVLTNEGNGYNTETGIFTVPSSGVYVFNITVETKMIDGNHGLVAVHLMVDGKNQVDAIAKSFSDQHNMQSSNSAVVKLEAGQKVWIETYEFESQFFEGTYEGKHVFNSFTGYRIV